MPVYQPFVHEWRAAYAETFNAEWNVDEELRTARGLFTKLCATGHAERLAERIR